MFGTVFAAKISSTKNVSMSNIEEVISMKFGFEFGVGVDPKLM